MAVGDFNLDGKPDLATANADSNNVTILLGDGTGGFTQPASSPEPWGLALSRWRWATSTSTASPTSPSANCDSNNVTILLGDGMGGFTQPPARPSAWGAALARWRWATSTSTASLTSPTANADSDNVTILLGNGTGGFTRRPPRPSAWGLVLLSVAVGDFNLDGKPDLATANSCLRQRDDPAGQWDGRLHAAADSPVGVGTGPVSVAVGDFNLDGKPDLADGELITPTT